METNKLADKLEKNTLYKVYIGLYDGELKKQVITTESALNIVNSYLVDHFGGATITHGFGIYKHDDGTIVSEPSLIVELFYTDDNSIYDFINHVRILLNQESIGLVKIPMEVGFIS